MNNCDLIFHNKFKQTSSYNPSRRSNVSKPQALSPRKAGISAARFVCPAIFGILLSCYAFARDGDPERKFGSQGRTIIDFGNRAGATDLVVAPDGKMVLTGWVQNNVTGQDFAVARLNSNGLLDTSFSSDGITTVAVGTGVAYDNPGKVFLQADGKIVIVGTGPDTGALNDDSDMQIVRLNTDGSLDTTFSGDGKAFVAFNLGGSLSDSAGDGLQLPNGRLLIVGAATGLNNRLDIAIAKLNADGTRDTTFHGDGRHTIRFNETAPPYRQFAVSLAVDSLGNILVGGSATIGASNDFAILRLTPNGDLDPTFGLDGHVTFGFNEGGTESDTLSKIVVASDNSIFATGRVTGPDGDSEFGIVKFLSSGAVDTTYGTNGKTVIPFDLGGNNNDISYSVVLQGGGKLLVTGTVSTVPAYTGGSIGLARLDSTGNLDPTFGFVGKKVFTIGGYAEALASGILNGRLVYGGFTLVNGDEQFLAGAIIIDTILNNGFE